MLIVQPNFMPVSVSEQNQVFLVPKQTQAAVADMTLPLLGEDEAILLVHEVQDIGQMTGVSGNMAQAPKIGVFGSITDLT